MHESPIARQLVEAATREAGGQGEAKITRMEVRLGPDGAYVPDSLRMHILAAATGSTAEGAEVDITPVLVGGAELVSIEIEERA